MKAHCAGLCVSCFLAFLGFGPKAGAINQPFFFACLSCILSEQKSEEQMCERFGFDWPLLCNEIWALTFGSLSTKLPEELAHPVKPKGSQNQRAKNLRSFFARSMSASGMTLYVCLPCHDPSRPLSTLLASLGRRPPENKLRTGLAQFGATIHLSSEGTPLRGRNGVSQLLHTPSFVSSSLLPRNYFTAGDHPRKCKGPLVCTDEEFLQVLNASLDCSSKWYKCSTRRTRSKFWHVQPGFNSITGDFLA